MPACPAVQPGHIAAAPRLNQQTVTGPQVQAVTGGQHMVGGLAAARQPDPAMLHPQPTGAARLQLQSAVQMQLARHRRQRLQRARLMKISHAYLQQGWLGKLPATTALSSANAGP